MTTTSPFQKKRKSIRARLDELGRQLRQLTDEAQGLSEERDELLSGIASLVEEKTGLEGSIHVLSDLPDDELRNDVSPWSVSSRLESEWSATLELTLQQQQNRILNLEAELAQLTETLDLTRRQRDWHSQDRDNVLRLAEEHGRSRFALEGELAALREQFERSAAETAHKTAAATAEPSREPAGNDVGEMRGLPRLSILRGSSVWNLGSSWWRRLRFHGPSDGDQIVSPQPEEPESTVASLNERTFAAGPDTSETIDPVEPAAPRSNAGETSEPDSPAAGEILLELPPVERTNDTPYLQTMREFVAEFQRRFGRTPAILDWSSGIVGVADIRDAAVFAPAIEGQDHLPYVDSSVDAIVLPRAAAEEREAARVAETALLVVEQNSQQVHVEWLEGPCPKPPTTVSIIIPVHDHLFLTTSCINAVRTTLPSTFAGEIIVVDDASTDGTRAYLELLVSTDARFRVVRNETNAGFLESANRGAAVAESELLLFLNNDTIPRPGWLDALVETFRAYPDCGVAGGKLLYPDGRLQEAGGIIFADASGLNFGKHSSPDHPLYSFVRDVDYCSGAVLATRRDLWNEIGGFDTRYRPAYYEDTDYCFTVRARGKRVLYQPACEVVHLEGGTSGVDLTSGTKQAQVVNRSRFAMKWETELKKQFHPPEQIDVSAEFRLLFPPGKRRILVINPTVPEYDRESGSKRLFDMLRFLVEDGWAVTFMTSGKPVAARYARELEQMGIATFERAFKPLNELAYEDEGHRLIVNGCFDAALICFWHIAEQWVPLIRSVSPHTKIIVDSVDLHFLRTVRAALRPDKPRSTRELHPDEGAAFRQEMNAYAAADRVLTVSEKEAEILNDFLSAPGLAVAVPDIEQLDLSPSSFEERQGILFIGSFRHPPNCEAAEYLLRKILPLVDPELLEEHPLRIVGTDLPEEMIALARRQKQVEIVGWVPSIHPYLERARISVLPLLSGAGTKRKFIQSAMIGTPAVATTIAAEGLNLVNETDTLIADDPVGFARAIERLLRDEQTWSRMSRNARQVVLRTHTRAFGRCRLLGALSSPLDGRQRVSGTRCFDNYTAPSLS